MRGKRSGLILAVVALVALAIAVPVVAGSLATPGGTGTINFVNVNTYGPDWQTAPPNDPRGPAGTFTYTASVITTQTSEPQEIVKFSFTGCRLSPGVPYALVNTFQIHRVEPLAIDVHVLGSGFANKAGIVCIKGTATLADLAQYPGDRARASGARLRLLPAFLLTEDYNHPNDFFIADTGTLFSVLGVPIILPENWGADTQD